MNRKLTAAILSASILLSGIPVAGQVSAADLGSGEIVRSVNFRSAPRVADNQIRYLRTGETVDILDKVNRYWYRIKDRNGKVGYVSTSTRYIDVTETGSRSDGDSSAISGNAAIVRGVSFRTGPGTSHHRMRYLQRGEKVTILEKTNRYWYKIRDKNGTIGYASTSSRYISTSWTPPDIPNTSANVQKVIEAGMKYLGTPYEYGSSRSNTSTFDCSDFVRQAFYDGVGLRLPADSRKQAEFVRIRGSERTGWRNLKPGDIMFFMSYKGSDASDYSGINKMSQRITHDGIYIGDGKVLHTYSRRSGGVKISKINNTHWEYRFIFGGSALD